MTGSLTFHAGTSDVATCMYYTGIDPFTKKEVYIARQLKDRKMQRALLQFFKPENYFEVRKALEEAGRKELIGSGCDALISPKPPREAWRDEGSVPTKIFAVITLIPFRIQQGMVTAPDEKRPNGAHGVNTLY